MLPLFDDNPRNTIPYVSWTIIALCLAVFVWQLSLSDAEMQSAVYQYGVIPARLLARDELAAGLETIPAFATVLTSMFMHGDLYHLAYNMLFLWIFGDNIEDSMGHLRLLAFYLLCGIIAALAQAGLDPNSPIPMIGASGAISGVLGGYILLHPFANIRVFFLIIIIPMIINIPAALVLGLWFAGQIFNAAVTPPDQAGIAFGAHIGGFVAGLILINVFKRRDVPILQRPLSKPFGRERVSPWRRQS